MAYKRKRSFSVTRKRAKKIFRKRSATAKRRSRALTKKIKSVILKTSEPKAVGSLQLGATAIAETLYVYNLSSPPYNSVLYNDWNARAGQHIYHLGANVTGMIQNDGTGNPQVFSCTMVRFMILETAKKANVSLLDINKACFIGPDLNEVTLGSILGSAASMNYKVHSDWYKTLFNKVYTIGNVGNGRDSRLIKIHKRWKKKIEFDGTSTGAQNQNKMIFLAMWAYRPRDGPLTYGPWSFQISHGGIYSDP